MLLAPRQQEFPPGHVFQKPPIPIENGRQVALVVTSALAVIIPSILVGLRFWVRRAVAHRPIDASDWCIFAALLSNIALHIDMYIMVLMGGFGFHVQEIFFRFGPEVGMHFFKGILAFPMIWNLTVCFSKLSVLFMYVNVFPVTKMLMACRGLGLFIILWNTGGILGALLMCRPFALNWDKTLDGTCGDVPLYYTWLGAINVVVEGTMLLLPVPFLFKLQLKMSRRLLVIALFSIGWMTCAVSIYRQATLPGLNFADMPFEGVLVTILTGVEPAIALSLACVPFLRALFVRDGGSTGKDSRYASTSKGSKSGIASPFHSNRGRQFEELHDDSSVLQLQPVGRDGYESAAVGGGEDNGEAVGHSHKNAVVVKTTWNVKSAPGGPAK